MTLKELLKKMEEMFNLRPNRMTLYKEFENRKWKYDETFSDYYYTKIVLANNVSIEDVELVDYIIDGITCTTTESSKDASL